MGREFRRGRGPTDPDGPRTGFPPLDEIIGLRWGDNVAWVIDAGVDGSFAEAALAVTADVAAFETVLRDPTSLSDPDDQSAFTPTLVAADLSRSAHVESTFTGWAVTVFARRTLGFWFVFTDSPSHSVVTSLAQCVIEVGETHLTVRRADGRGSGSRDVTLPWTIESGRLTVGPPSTAWMLGRGLRELRRSRGWSQAELAAVAGVSASAISQSERGQHSLSLDTVLGLANRTNSTVDSLLRAPTADVWVQRGSPSSTAVMSAAPIESTFSHSMTARIPFQASIAIHAGAATPGMLFIGSGTVLVNLPHRTILARAGDTVWTKGRAVTSVRNTGPDEALIFVLSGENK